jgi:FkbM family methyltransferase
MSWYTSRLGVMLRNIGRATRMNRLVAGLVSERQYEAKYTRQLFDYIAPGQCVWDVGANVGHFTAMFADAVSSTGTVYAFEPSPANFPELVGRCGGLENVSCMNCGLGKSDEYLPLQQGDDALGATSRIATRGRAGKMVELRAADSLLADIGIRSPNVVKIDVEGYELEVLEGMTKLLGSVDLMMIGVEVHFGVLEERGLHNAPRRLEKLLTEAGFSISWPDHSHILAVR